MKELSYLIDHQFHPETEDDTFATESIPSEQEISLYLHIPFCRHICNFCSFPREVAQTPTIQTYVEALAIQTKRFSDSLSNPVISIYFGGGTPSILNSEQLQVLMDSVSRFHLIEGAKITLEARSDDISPEFLRHIKEQGINRISVGVQTLASEARLAHGLPGDPTDVISKLEMLADSGLVTNVDLIYGGPDQSLGSWNDTLDAVLQLKPEQISAYPFMFLAGTAVSEDPYRPSLRYLYTLVESLLYKTRLYGYAQTDAFMFSHLDLLTSPHTSHDLPHKPYKDLRREPIIGLGQGAFSMLPKKIVVNPYDVHGFCQSNTPEMEYLIHEGIDVPTAYAALRHISSLIPTADSLPKYPFSPPGKNEVLLAMLVSQIWKNVYQTTRDWYTYSRLVGFHTTNPTRNLPKNPKYQGSPES